MMQGAVVVWILSALVCLGTGYGYHKGNEDLGTFKQSFLKTDYEQKAPSGHEDNRLLQLLADHAANNLSMVQSAMVQSANKGFAFDLYRNLAAQTDSRGKNIFFSPSSVSMALAALSVGARGQTHQQLFSGLGFNSSSLNQADVNQAFRGLLTKTLSEDVSAGTAVFVDNKFKPQPEFLDALSKSYLADGKTVDFNNSTESAATINKYVGEKTNGKIDQLVENLDPDTLMYLISYVYYKGKWKTQFNPKKTREEDFTVDVKTESKVRVQMMNRQDWFDQYYDRSIDTDVLRLPFQNSYYMLLLVPYGNMARLEEHICPMHYTKWLNAMRSAVHYISVPKFSIKTNVKLNGVLRQMGMTDMFGAAANFSGIAEDAFVSEVVHQVTLDVDETGATAAAVTGVGNVLQSAPPQLRFDRPFMVLIADSSHNILFMGKIVNPNLR